MNMKNWTSTAMGVVCMMALAMPTEALATTTRFYSAWGCFGNDASDLDGTRTTTGLSNVDATFFCPAVAYVSNLVTFSSTDVYYLSALDELLSCTWYGADDVGDVLSSATRYSCSTSGGCTTSGGTQGTTWNNIQWTSTAGGGTLITGAAVNAPFYGVECTGSGTNFTYPKVAGYATITDN
jgi:hypothetical protein